MCLQIFFLTFHTTTYLLAYIVCYRVRVRCRSTLEISYYTRSMEQSADKRELVFSFVAPKVLP